MEIFVVIKNIPLFNHFKGKVIQNVIYFCIWILYKRTAKTFFSLQGITLSLKLSLREDPFNLFCCSYFSLQWTVALLLQQKNVSLHFHFTSVSFSDHKQWWDYLKVKFFSHVFPDISEDAAENNGSSCRKHRNFLFYFFGYFCAFGSKPHLKKSAYFAEGKADKRLSCTCIQQSL